MTAHPSSATPVRRLGGEVVDGVHLLVDASVHWRDGGEEEVFELLGQTTDRSVLSEELRHHEHSWETEYHFSSERSHIIRGLALPAGATVLEVGAGCGAVTRHLGEVAGVVDALEPDHVRARAAARRCADLPNVQVHAGPVQSIPVEPAYDVIVVVGVLEYVGARDGWADRVAWLRHLAGCLKPGGTLVCAIENRLGVQYLSGAPEDHLARSFAGLEDYPEPGPVRTFDRATLQRLFVEAGLAPEVKHVFPDYKFARIVFSDALLDGEAAPVAWRAPAFPSGASPHRRPTLTAEEPLWRSLVRGGLGGQFANSFLVVATDAGAGSPSPLWPPDQLAVFWGQRRRPLFAVQTRVVQDNGGVVFERRRLLDDAPAVSDGDLELRPRPRASLAPGVPIIELLEDADAAERVRLLAIWRRHVESAPVEGPLDIETGPQHVLLAPDGTTTATIDDEWFDASYTLDDVLSRGVLTAAIRLAGACPPSRWPEGLETVADLAGQLAEEAQITFDLEAAADREARMLAAVIRVPPREHPDPVVACRRSLQVVLDRRLDHGPLGERDIATERPPSLAMLEARATELHHTVDWLHQEVAARDAQIAALRGRVGPSSDDETPVAEHGAGPSPEDTRSPRRGVGRILNRGRR